MIKFLILSLATTLLLISCEDKDDDKIYQAQMCLNNATSATVDTCVAKVAGIGTSQAYVIRCSADFLRADITETTIVNALDQLDKNNDPNKSGTVTLFAFLKFGNTTLADAAVANCLLTGSATLHDLALSAKAATVINSIAGSVDLDDLETWVDSLNPGMIDALNPTDLLELGETLIELAPSICGDGGQFEGNKVCVDLNAALSDPSLPATTDPSYAEEVAKLLLAQLQVDNG